MPAAGYSYPFLRHVYTYLFQLSLIIPISNSQSHSTQPLTSPRLFPTVPINKRRRKRQYSLIWYLSLPPQHITYSLPMPITTYSIYGTSLDTLRQTSIALLVTCRRILVVVGGTPEEAHAVAEGTAPLVLQAAPVVPVQTGLRVDNMSDAGISLQRMVSVRDKQRVTNWEGGGKENICRHAYLFVRCSVVATCPPGVFRRRSGRRTVDCPPSSFRPWC